MTFEWDEEKNTINIAKHGIPFNLAALVFLDEKHIEMFDKKHSDYEDRWNIIGQAGKILFVVYTERKENTIRIISARKATKEEINEYYKNYDIR